MVSEQQAWFFAFSHHTNPPYQAQTRRYPSRTFGSRDDPPPHAPTPVEAFVTQKRPKKTRRVLKVFISQRGKGLTRQMLVREVWGDEDQDRQHSLHVYVARLRQKIEPVPERPCFLLTIPGVGYRFQEAPEEEQG